MTTLRKQTEEKFATTRMNNPEFAKRIDDLLASADAFQARADAIEVGQKAPDFALPNSQNETISLSSLLASGPLVVTFYRGSWCPYCNLQMQAMQQRLPKIQALGAELVGISPQVSGELPPTESETSAPLILSDQDARVAAAYGVAWNVPDLILDHMRNDRKLDLAKINGGNANVLPIPATFVLNGHGTVTWRFVDVDYRKRAEPEEIITVLRGLSD